MTLQIPNAINSIAIMPECEDWRDMAHELAQSRGWLVVDAPPQDGPVLIVGNEGLALQDGQGQLGNPIRVDWVHGELGYRLRKGEGRRQPLGRAIGLKPGYNPTVIDATAGLGRDGAIMASLGCKVVLLERSPIIFALLDDGLRRARLAPELKEITSRVTHHQANAANWLPTNQDLGADVVYLDPMFPHREKSALVKKEMRLFRSLLGDDLDADLLLNAALQSAHQRVVVKRPRHAPWLGERKPNHSLEGQSTRFDVYLCAS